MGHVRKWTRGFFAPVNLLRPLAIWIVAALLLGGCGQGAEVTTNATPGSGTSPSSSNPAPTLSSAVTGSATLSWVPPTQNTDGSPVTGLAGYHIHYGTDAATLTQTIDVAGAGVTSFVITALTQGTYFFTITAYTAQGTESAPSNVGTITI
jgi:hypothetical protein